MKSSDFGLVLATRIDKYYYSLALEGGAEMGVK